MSDMTNAKTPSPSANAMLTNMFVVIGPRASGLRPIACSALEAIMPTAMPGPRTPMEMAIEALKSWLVPSMGCEVIGEELGYFDVLSDLVVNARITGPAVHDARVAAICLHNGVRALWTADRDFSRFGALKTHNPVAVA